MKKPIIYMLVVGLSAVFTSTPVSADHRARATGSFTASVDFTTVSLRPIGRNCLLTIDGELQFTGTIEGVAIGTTRALVFGSCDDVAVTPPGTFADVFRSNLEFFGTVDGQPAVADLVYQGVTRVGGNIRATLRFSNGLTGRLRVDAVVVQGGTYRGFVRL